VSAARHAVPRVARIAGEARKLPAFVRRDFLVAWSYRVSFFGDIVNLAAQALAFSFIGRIVDSERLPTYGGGEVTYLEFAAVGIALGAFVQFALARVPAAIRGEQLMGTLESVMATPTAPATVQIGSVAFDLFYIPVRTAVFLGVIAAAFGLRMDPAGIAPAIAILIAFIPFVWGLGVASAALVVAFRRGAGVVGLGTIALALVSGLYFPVDLLPDWIAAATRHNPFAVAIEGMREALLGDLSGSQLAVDLALLAPLSAASLAVGVLLFRLALRRERRLGTLGLY
jgi:ABC-2 type transport system permease protein